MDVGELGTDHEVAVNGVATTAYDNPIAVGGDVFDRILTGAAYGAAAAESDSCHCNGSQYCSFSIVTSCRK